MSSVLTSGRIQLAGQCYAWMLTVKLLVSSMQVLGFLRLVSTTWNPMEGVSLATLPAEKQDLSADEWSGEVGGWPRLSGFFSEPGFFLLESGAWLTTRYLRMQDSWLLSDTQLSGPLTFISTGR